MTSIETTLRAYSIEDNSSLKEILDNSFGVGYFDCNRLSSENCIVADNGAVVGMIYCVKNAIEFELKTIAVRLDMRGKGIATRLLNHIVLEGVSKNIRRLWAPAWDDGCRAPAAKLLESVGLSLTIEISDYWMSDSIGREYSCPKCGNPCRCSAQIFEKLIPLS